MNFPMRSAALGALLLTGASSALAKPTTAEQYQSWTRAIDTLAERGYPRVEEIELDRGGSFEVEAIDTAGIEHRVRLNADGGLRSARAGHRHDDVADSVDLATLRAVLAWLPSQGELRLHEISGDDGRIEVEAIAADGSRRSLQFDPKTVAGSSER